MMDDDRRWLLAVLADTGMRLAEVTGLAVQDIKLEATVLHIDLRPHDWRPLKNAIERTNVSVNWQCVVGSQTHC
jgi:integrase